MKVTLIVGADGGRVAPLGACSLAAYFENSIADQLRGPENAASRASGFAKDAS